MAEYVAEDLHVTRTSVRKYMTLAVADGGLLEVQPRRDWLVRLPWGDDLPDLYAVPADPGYRLVLTKPESKGSGQISFVITPASLGMLLRSLRKQLKLPQRRPGASPLYDPAQRRTLSRDLYAQAVDEVRKSAGVDEETAKVAVSAVLGALNMRLPGRRS